MYFKCFLTFHIVQLKCQKQMVQTSRAFLYFMETLKLLPVAASVCVKVQHDVKQKKGVMLPMYAVCALSVTNVTHVA